MKQEAINELGELAEVINNTPEGDKSFEVLHANLKQINEQFKAQRQTELTTDKGQTIIFNVIKGRLKNNKIKKVNIKKSFISSMDKIKTSKFSQKAAAVTKSSWNFIKGKWNFLRLKVYEEPLKWGRDLVDAFRIGKASFKESRNLGKQQKVLAKPKASKSFDSGKTGSKWESVKNSFRNSYARSNYNTQMVENLAQERQAYKAERQASKNQEQIKMDFESLDNIVTPVEEKSTIIQAIEALIKEFGLIPDMSNDEKIAKIEELIPLVKDVLIPVTKEHKPVQEAPIITEPVPSVEAIDNVIADFKANPDMNQEEKAAKVETLAPEAPSIQIPPVTQPQEEILLASERFAIEKERKEQESKQAELEAEEKERFAVEYANMTNAQRFKHDQEQAKKQAEIDAEVADRAKFAEKKAALEEAKKMAEEQKAALELANMTNAQRFKYEQEQAKKQAEIDAEVADRALFEEHKGKSR